MWVQSSESFRNHIWVSDRTRSHFLLPAGVWSGVHPYPDPGQRVDRYHMSHQFLYLGGNRPLVAERNCCPAKLQVGYAKEIYYAWASVYLEEIGWIDNIISFDGHSWTLVDPTFAASHNAKDLKAFISYDKNYKLKYTYWEGSVCWDMESFLFFLFGIVYL